MSKEQNRTKPLRLRDYLSTGGQLNMTALTDAALESLAGIRWNGVGRQQNRSRGVIMRTYREALEQAGFDGKSAQQAVCNLRDIDALNALADE